MSIDLNRNLRRGIEKDCPIVSDKREIVVESVSDFHIHDVKILSGRTRKEINA